MDETVGPYMANQIQKVEAARVQVEQTTKYLNGPLNDVAQVSGSALRMLFLEIQELRAVKTTADRLENERIEAAYCEDTKRASEIQGAPAIQSREFNAPKETMVLTEQCDCCSGSGLVTTLFVDDHSSCMNCNGSGVLQYVGNPQDQNNQAALAATAS